MLKIRTAIKNDKINWKIIPANVTAVALYVLFRKDVRQKVRARTQAYQTEQDYRFDKIREPQWFAGMW
jgi:hypothetical protein